MSAWVPARIPLLPGKGVLASGGSFLRTTAPLHQWLEHHVGPDQTYLPALALSRATLAHLAGVIRRYRRQIGSCWRKCNTGQQALLVLAHLRKGETFAALVARFGIGTATAWRYVREAVALLAAEAPRLRDASSGQEGRACLRSDGRHPHPHRQGGR